MAVAARAELAGDLVQKAARLAGALNRLTQECRLRLQRAERGLPEVASLLGAARQRLDDRVGRLVLALPNLLAARRTALVAVERHLPAPWQIIEARRGGVALLSQRLRGGLQHLISRRRAEGARVTSRLTIAPLAACLREARSRLDGMVGRLESVSPEAVLKRGYVLVFDRGGAPLSSAAEVRPGAALRLHFADGDMRAVAARPDEERQSALPL
jgi:exodeoxyribonuclease VII large subunit